MSNNQMRQPLSNLEICQQIHAGSAAAERAFYEQFYGTAVQVIVGIKNNTEEAPDLAHETLIRVLMRLRSRPLKDPIKLDRYVKRTARFVTYAALRSSANFKPITMHELPDSSLVSDRDGLQNLLNDENIGDVEELLKGLSRSRDRALIRQHYLMDLPKTVVCQNLGLKPSQFDRVAYNARARLKKIFQESKPDQLDHYINEFCFE